MITCSTSLLSPLASRPGRWIAGLLSLLASLTLSLEPAGAQPVPTTLERGPGAPINVLEQTEPAEQIWWSGSQVAFDDFEDRTAWAKRANGVFPSLK